MGKKLGCVKVALSLALVFTGSSYLMAASPTQTPTASPTSSAQPSATPPDVTVVPPPQPPVPPVPPKPAKCDVPDYGPITQTLTDSGTSTKNKQPFGACRSGAGNTITATIFNNEFTLMNQFYQQLYNMGVNCPECFNAQKNSLVTLQQKVNGLAHQVAQMGNNGIPSLPTAPPLNFGNPSTIKTCRMYDPTRPEQIGAVNDGRTALLDLMKNILEAFKACVAAKNVK